jgi:hypothetical protein
MNAAWCNWLHTHGFLTYVPARCTRKAVPWRAGRRVGIKGFTMTEQEYSDYHDLIEYLREQEIS